MNDNKNWFNRAKKDAGKKLPINERIFGILIIIFCFITIIYFVNHQIQLTGFFTTKFGIIEISLFYGFWIFWMSTAILEAILSQRLLSRILDTFGGLIFATISLIILLFIFPFEFTHLADLLPNILRFIINWINNDIAQIIIGILIILHLAAAIYCPFAYKFIDNKLFKSNKKSN